MSVTTAVVMGMMIVLVFLVVIVMFVCMVSAMIVVGVFAVVVVMVMTMVMMVVVVVVVMIVLVFVLLLLGSLCFQFPLPLDGDRQFAHRIAYSPLRLGPDGLGTTLVAEPSQVQDGLVFEIIPDAYGEVGDEDASLQGRFDRVALAGRSLARRCGSRIVRCELPDVRRVGAQDGGMILDLEVSIQYP